MLKIAEGRKYLSADGDVWECVSVVAGLPYPAVCTRSTEKAGTYARVYKLDGTPSFQNTGARLVGEVPKEDAYMGQGPFSVGSVYKDRSGDRWRIVHWTQDDEYHPIRALLIDDETGEFCTLTRLTERGRVSNSLVHLCDLIEQVK